MFVEYVQLLNDDGGGGFASGLLNGPLPWIAAGAILVAVVWTLKK